jgi:hypothetical protein
MSLSHWLLVLPFALLGPFTATIAAQMDAGSTGTAQDPPQSAVHYLPLQEGARWTHRVRRQPQDEPQTTQLFTLVDEGAYALLDGRPVHQARVEQDLAVGMPSYEYWSARGNGIRRHFATEQTADHR